MQTYAERKEFCAGIHRNMMRVRGEYTRAERAVMRGDLPAAREAMEAAVYHAEQAQIAIQRSEHAINGTGTVVAS